jgi:LEA14-like dessication related protein
MLAAAVAAAPPIGLAIRPGPADTFNATLTGDAPGEAAGVFSGSIALNGSPTTLPVSGRAERTGGRLRVPLTLRYADIPADWANRLRLGTLDYRVLGTVAGRDRLEWSGSIPWSGVSVEGEKETASVFVRLASLELTSFTFFESEARAVVSVRNPLSFPLKVAGASYRLFANDREVGSGQLQGLLLHAKQDNSLDFPIEIEHGQLLAAAGSALASGGEIDGQLRGELQVRLPGGDIAVPLNLSGKVSLLSE